MNTVRFFVVLFVMLGTSACSLLPESQEGVEVEGSASESSIAPEMEPPLQEAVPHACRAQLEGIFAGSRKWGEGVKSPLALEFRDGLLASVDGMPCDQNVAQPYYWPPTPDQDCDQYVLCGGCPFKVYQQFGFDEVSGFKAEMISGATVIDGEPSSFHKMNYAGCLGSKLAQYSGGWEISSECVPDCDGRTCGDDGCGGTCGSCREGICSMTNVKAYCYVDSVPDSGVGSSTCRACIAECSELAGVSNCCTGSGCLCERECRPTSCPEELELCCRGSDCFCAETAGPFQCPG